MKGVKKLNSRKRKNKKIKITQVQYGKIMDKKIKEIKKLPIGEQLAELLEEAGKYQIIKEGMK